jgi:transposase-like protein/IS1 family transposase
MTCLKCHHTAVRRFGTYGPRKIQRYRCIRCSATFSDCGPKVGSHILSVEQIARIVALLVEGMSIRAISRITGTDQNTIMSVLLTVGERCRRLFHAKIRGVRPRYVQLDELWCFVFKKEKRVSYDDPAEWGDTYTWIALDAQNRLIISYLVGKRDAQSAHTFIGDFSRRVAGRMQVTSDGFKPYIAAMEEAFGADVDFAQLIKLYTSPDTTGPSWYGPPKVIETVPTPISGNPDLDHVCTSHVERQNLTVRMHLRRFTRLTNGFSKKLSHLKAAVDLYMAWYNFARPHLTLRVTPAMEAGLTDHIWTIAELIG